jgi:hypothetical protein
LLDGEDDADVDLASYAYQIWQDAIAADPTLRTTIPDMPPVVYSTRTYTERPNRPGGALVYMRTGHDVDALAWVDAEGFSVTESQYEILRAAECKPETPAIPRLTNHHALVEAAAKQIIRDERKIGGQLGRPSSARHRTYERLKDLALRQYGTLFESAELNKAVEEIYRFPLTQTATGIINDHLRAGINDESLADLVILLRGEDRLCVVIEDGEKSEPKIICSMGLTPKR